jgi:hypothetical protein
MFLLSLLACFGTVNEKNFIEKYSEALCTFEDECNRSAFLEEWDDVDECVEDSLDAIDDADLDLEDCDFDKDKAKDCLDTIKDATEDCDAEDLADADECGEVFDCGDDGGGLGVGPGGVTEDNFADLYFEAYCGAGCSADISFVCDTPFTTKNTTGTNQCDFDARAAAACVDVDNWTCEPLIEGSDDTYPTAPADCIDVCG